MRQKLFIFLGLIVLIIVLIGLNAASYTQKEKMPDSEIFPNRSTFNSGATGTRAFYDLLAETGRNPTRWQQSPAELLTAKNKPSTFVVIGELRNEFSDEEAASLLQWVAEGGKLVIIDREPPKNLVKTTANWNVSLADDYRRPFFGTDASDQKQMTAGAKASKPVQPTVFTKSVNAVQTSQFAASVNFERFADAEFQTQSKQPTPALIYPETVETVALTAPVVHLANGNRNLLVDVPYGSGQIVFLTDPYIVANGGIGLVDNAQLLINIVASRGGTIAFDEYHQGFGTNNNRFLQFFAGTPVVAIFLQIALLVGLIFFSQSRRFARPVPEPEPNRLSKLEYVSAMAQLQQRTKGYDLAIENIYTDFRRRTARLVGVDNFSTQRHDLAQLIAERLPSENSNEIEELMRKCEYIVQGEPTGKKEVLQLTRRLREIEEKLGLQRRKKLKSKK